jgi:hypothetical protein
MENYKSLKFIKFISARVFLKKVLHKVFNYRLRVPLYIFYEGNDDALD